MDDKFHIRLESLETNVQNAIEFWGNKMQASLSQQPSGLTKPPTGSGTANLPNLSAPQQFQDDVQTLHSSVHDGFIRLLSIADSYKSEGYSFTNEDEDRVYLLSFVEDVVSESGRTLEQSADDVKTVAHSTARQLDIGPFGVDIANWIDLQPSGPRDDQSWIRAPPTLPRSAFSVAGDRYFPSEPPLDPLLESDESDDDENVEISKWTLDAAQQAYEQALWAEAYDYFRVGLQQFQQRPLKHQHAPEFWQFRYKLVISAFHSQTQDIAEDALCSFAAMEAADDEQRMLQCKAGLLLAKLYARQGRLELAQRSCRTARIGIKRLKGADNDDVYDALALQSTLYELNGSEESLRNSKSCAFQIPDEQRDSCMLSHRDLLSLPQGALAEHRRLPTEIESGACKVTEWESSGSETRTHYRTEDVEDEEIDRTIAGTEAAECEQEGRHENHAAKEGNDRETGIAQDAKEDAVDHTSLYFELPRYFGVGKETAFPERARGQRRIRPSFDFLNRVTLPTRHSVAEDTDSIIETSGSTTGEEQSTIGSSLMHNDTFVTTLSLTDQKVEETQATANEELEWSVADSIKQFAGTEKLRLKQSQSAKQNVNQKERIEKLDDLKKFARNFTLKTRIPDDLVPVIAKDEKKQLEIRLRADELAKQRELARKHKDEVTQEATCKAPKPLPRPTNDVVVTPNVVKHENQDARFTVKDDPTTSFFTSNVPNLNHSRSPSLQADFEPSQQHFPSFTSAYDGTKAGVYRTFHPVTNGSNGYTSPPYGLPSHASLPYGLTSYSSVPYGLTAYPSVPYGLPSHAPSHAPLSYGLSPYATLPYVLPPPTFHLSSGIVPSMEQRRIFLKASQTEPFPIDLQTRRAWLDALQIRPRGSLQQGIVDTAVALWSYYPEPGRLDGQVTTSHLAALFGDTAYCRRLQFTKDKDVRCEIALRYTYGNPRVRAVDLAMATARAEIAFLAYKPFAVELPYFENESSHAPPAYLFHESWLRLTGANTNRVLDVLELIIPQLFHVNTWMNGKRWTLLHFAVCRTQEHLGLRLAATSFLLNHGAMRGVRTKDGNIPLHLASSTNETSEIVDLLLCAQAREQLDAVNDRGQTSLDLAVAYRVRNKTKIGLEVIRRLLEASVNAGSLRNFKSMTGVAEEAHDHELSDLLTSSEWA